MATINLKQKLEEILSVQPLAAYAGFEPMPSNMVKFADTVERLKGKIGTGVIFPCAVGAKNEVLTFTDASSSSRHNREREELVA
ncbi:hypothetical protein FACS1894187_03350 [Synergistales bacterium]|nr:hypothetical protein FACS1894187_03350 [Synergistales bacterium]